MVEEFKIGFWNTGCSPNYENHIFGCSSIGYATSEKWIEPIDEKPAFWEHNLTGESISGSYQSTLGALSSLAFMPKFCLAFFNKAIGVDDFLRQYRLIMPHVKIIGGGAARTETQNLGEILPTADDVTILAVSEGDFTFQTLNIYDSSGISVEIKASSDREFEQLRQLPEAPWQNAIEFYRNQQEFNAIDAVNFELMTFCDNNQRNLHCGTDGKVMKTGANLPENNILNLGITTHQKAEEALTAFIAGNNSLIVGCAGIRSLIRNPLKTGKKSLAGFLFGEVFTLDGNVLFGNLMLTKINKINIF